MMKRNFTAALAIFAMVSLFAFSGPAGAAKKIKIPPGKAIDLRIIENGKVTAQGVKAVKQISRANLVLYLAGNQFMAMGDVIGAFQKTHPGVKKVFVETLPPGLILRQILRGGGVFKGVTVPPYPDIYASVNIKHLKRLAKKGLMTHSRLYLHNKLEIMVPRETRRGSNPLSISSSLGLKTRTRT